MSANSNQRQFAAFTLVEVLVAMAIFGLFLSGLMAMWGFLGTTALNTTSYAQRQNDQMRVLDYLKRDIHRATKVELYNGATLITGTNTAAAEVRLTIPDYYADAREEDNAIGSKTINSPVLTSGEVTYGTPLTVRFYAAGGAAVRDENGTLRTVGSAAGGFTLSFMRETSGAIRCQVFFDQRMRSGTNRTLRRQVEALFVPRCEFLL